MEEVDAREGEVEVVARARKRMTRLRYSAGRYSIEHLQPDKISGSEMRHSLGYLCGDLGTAIGFLASKWTKPGPVGADMA